MIKKTAVFIFTVLLLMNICGCVALVAGAAGGAGTAVWFSGKLTQEVNVSFERAVKAVKEALGSLNLKLAKETLEQDTAQIMSKYTDGRAIWIDVHRITESSSRIEVRVGIKPDKESTDKILKKIMRYL